MASAAAEWLAIVETQQRELQQLRAQVAVTPEREQWVQGAPSAFAFSPARSDTSSSSSSSSGWTVGNGRGEEDAVSLDLQRYASVCEQLEATRQRLTLKDAKHRELRVRAAQMKREVDEYRRELKLCNTRVEALATQLVSEQTSKQEAIDRAAQAMVQSEELATRLEDAEREITKLRSEMHLRNDMTQELQRRHSKTREETSVSRDTISRLEEALRLLQREKNALGEQLLTAHELQREHICVSDAEAALRDRLEEQERILSLQTAQLERQQLAIVELHAATAMLEKQLLAEQTQNQSTVSQQLLANVALQQIIDDYVRELRAVKSALSENDERVQMQNEEIAAYSAWRTSVRQRDSQREVTLSETNETKEKLERALRLAETSRRKVIMELADTKRQLGKLQAAMVGVDNELQRMNKTFGVFKAREANVSRTLREYGRRNRLLLDAVKLMSTKVIHLSNSLQRSEKRKLQVVVKSHELQRGLVQERCQREDLLQQCAELETCLLVFQRAATESADRAQSVERENAVLQHAVEQLCAYSREITQSQQALQRELAQLEVEGRAEPQVFG